MININEVAKETLITLKERGLKPTPENYSEIFEELSLKRGFKSSNQAKIEKYQALLLPHFQKELAKKPVRTLEELISFLVSILNRQSGKQFSEFFELLSTICKALQVSRDRKIKDLAKITSIRISKTMDSESIYLLDKKWKELERIYENESVDKELRSLNIGRYDDYELIIKKLVEKLNQRTFERFAELIAMCLSPSLVEDLKIQGFSANLGSNPSILNETNFKNELAEFVNRRIVVDNMYVQKNLNFFDENLKKINELYLLLSKQNKQNLDFVDRLHPDEKGEVKLSFEDLKAKFSELNEKISSLNSQIQFAQNLEERESWSVVKELEKLDENFIKYKVNYSLALFRISNYRFIMEKYGMGNLNEIFVRFKKILKESCEDFDELWMMDEKSYLIIAPGRDKAEIANLVEQNLKTIENFRFIYKQDVIRPKISVSFMDKASKPEACILEELSKQMNDELE
ncbi:hypothetical protein A9726_09820 [Campylobacter helveticus]|uniref:GGDEF domain-containing protein n=2 Tax=Campylobacter helveticus TaxID=28898 RepID=A0AAX2UKK8_9BACT|nr:hypothetical protein [Campylobacter helveticus]ARE80878.1 hypothetical protein CHELV3228_1298 [Campylobacter helveticus]TNB57568.1 hypothetical protein FDW42_04735 [Campylobacter helveticus]TNB57608.1 hypothetical protein FDW44_06560 [Campylobacter helveticus]TNH35329.1 hypothetical protein FDW48_01530 [Campylobacter helveticus]TXK49515.1 hypothetical protein A9726_09820 [Campylobacter helveticus]